MYKRLIYQIAESNRNFFCPNWNALPQSSANDSWHGWTGADSWYDEAPNRMYSTQLAPTRTSVIADRDTDGRRSRTTSAAAAEIFRNNRCKRRKPKTVELAAARESRRRPVYDCFVRPYGDPSGGIADTPMLIRLHCTAGAKHVRYIQNLSLTGILQYKIYCIIA